MKKLVILLAAALVAPLLLCLASPLNVSAGNKVEFTVTAKAVNQPFSSGIVVYTAEDGPVRLTAIENKLSPATLLLFNAEGRLIEAGGNLVEKEGACQEAVNIPKGGFLVAFTGDSKLMTTRNVAMENAMLYNATMGVIYPVEGHFDAATKQISIKYNNPDPAPEGAIRFLFVGNSSTYFSGTPILFKGLCRAAGVEIVADYCTFGSAYLSEFADENHERGKAFRNKIKYGKYDYIVFQDAAGATAEDSMASMSVLMPLAKTAGATPVFYMRYSTDTDEVSGKKRVDSYYANYNALSSKFHGILAPSAYSFYVCMRKYPEINLIADDGGHHSKAGAYIIACSWLYSILGIDPTGSSYTADLDDEVASHLQECAVISCEDPYTPYGTRASTMKINGKLYKNVAFGKPYTRTGEKYPFYTQTDHTLSGKIRGKLTDGVFSSLGGDNAIAASVGKNAEVVIDLEGLFDVYGIRADLFGGILDVPDPGDANLRVSFSVDGETFGDPELADRSPSIIGDWKEMDFSLKLPDPKKARYVKVEYLIDSEICWPSEIAVFGLQAAEEPVIDPSDAPHESYFPDVPWWTWVIIAAIFCAAAAGLIAARVIRKKKAQ